MSIDPIITVPKVLRTSLGEEGVEAPVNLINQAQVGGRRSMEEFVAERFERSLVEETGRLWIAIAELRAEMHAGFLGIQEQLKDVYREIANIHKSITSQTRWIVPVLIGAFLPVYFALAKLIFLSR